MKKSLKKNFTIFFILYQKIPSVSSLEKSPYFIFFPKDDRATIIYNFLLLRPCTLFVLHCNPLQGSIGKYRENPVMKTGTLQWKQGSPVMKAGFSRSRIHQHKAPKRGSASKRKKKSFLSPHRLKEIEIKTCNFFFCFY